MTVTAGGPVTEQDTERFDSLMSSLGSCSSAGGGHKDKGINI